MMRERNIYFRVTADDMRQFDVSVSPGPDFDAIVSVRGEAISPNDWQWSVRQRTGLSMTTGCGSGSSGESKTREEGLGRAMARLIAEIEQEDQP